MKMLTIALCFLATTLAVPQDGEEKRKACDLKTVEKTPYCEECDRLDPKLGEDDACEACEGKPDKVDACVKHYFTCGKCDKRLSEDKEHCDESKNTKRTNKTRIVFRCEGCGGYGDKDGEDCLDDDCREAGRKFRRTCEGSGVWPHGGKAPKKD